MATKYITLHPYNNNNNDLLPKVADLTINVNGTSHKYDGTGVLSVDITASSLGALTSADLSNYVTNDSLTTTLSTYATQTYVTDAIKAVTDNGIVNSVASDTLTITGTEKSYTSGTSTITGYNGDIKVELKNITSASAFDIGNTGTYQIYNTKVNYDAYGRIRGVVNLANVSFVSTLKSGDGISIASDNTTGTTDLSYYGIPTISLAESGVTSGSYGQAEEPSGEVLDIPYFTIDKYGRVTSAKSTEVSLSDYKPASLYKYTILFELVNSSNNMIADVSINFISKTDYSLFYDVLNSNNDNGTRLNTLSNLNIVSAIRGDDVSIVTGVNDSSDIIGNDIVIKVWNEEETITPIVYDTFLADNGNTLLQLNSVLANQSISDILNNYGLYANTTAELTNLLNYFYAKVSKVN